MKLSLTSLLLVTVALAADDNQQHSPADRVGHPSSHVLFDAPQVQQLGRALKQAALPSGNGINFHGGPVLTSTVTVYYIWYGNWNGNNGVTLLESFAKNLGGSPWFNINTTYTDASGSPVKNTIMFGGSTIDNYSQGKNLSDGQIFQAVSTAITSGKFPVDPNGVYFLLTSADVNATSGFCTAYCGWHSWNTLNGTMIKYAFVGDGGRCPSGCTAQPSNSPNGNVGADGMASVLAHELSETVSDPEGSGWWDNNGEENGDKCAWTFGVTFAAPNGSRANLTLAGTNYLIQQMYVNSNGGGCAMSYQQPLISAISPAVGSLGTAVPVTLTGSGFATGANLAISGAGVTTSNLAVVSPTKITATLNVAGNADLGAHSVSVTQGLSSSTPVTFTVNPAGFSLTQISPATGAAGTTVPVTLTGTNFATGATVATTSNAVVVSNVKVVSATQITASLALSPSMAAGPFSISVSQNGASSAPLPFTVTTTAVTLTGITPASVAVGSAANVTLVGTNFAANTTVAVSGTGVTVSAVKMVSATQLTATLTASATAGAGPRSVTVSTGSSTSQPVAFTVTAAPGFTSMTPLSGQAGGTTKLTVAGSNFNPGMTLAVSGTGVTVSGVTVASPTQLTANLVIDKSAAAGGRTVTATSGSVTSTVAVFTITPAPSLAYATPSSAAAGTTTKVTLTGANFVPGSTILIAGAGVTVNTVVVASATQITANFVVEPTAAPGARSVTVTSGSLTTAPATFTVTSPAATLTAISPATAAFGATASVTLTGTHFTNGTTIAFSGTGVTASTVTVVSPTQMTAQFAVSSTASAGARTVTVNNGTAASNGLTFTVTGAVATATLTSLDKTSGAAGSTLTMTATGTNFTSASKLTFSGTGITVATQQFVSATQITAALAIDAGAALGARTVTINNGTAASNGLPFNVTAAAVSTLSSLDKTSGAAGSTLTVTATGTNLTSASKLTFSGTGITVASQQLVSATQITAALAIDAGAALGARTVTINNGTAPSNGLPFNVTAAAVPTLTKLDKTSGAAGSTLTITATGTNFTTASKLNFSGTGITVGNLQVSATQILASLAIDGGAAAGTRTVTVSNGTAVSTPLSFTVTTSSPAITSLSPNSGILGNVLTATITGTGFTQNSTVVTGDVNIPVLQSVFVSATQMYVALGLGGTVGTHTLAVSVPGSTVTSAPATFTITMPSAPTTSGLTPATGVLGKTVSVTIQGANFTPDMRVTVSGSGVTVGAFTQGGPTFVSFPLTISATAATGVHNLTVSTPGGSSNVQAFTVTVK